VFNKLFSTLQNLACLLGFHSWTEMFIVEDIQGDFMELSETLGCLACEATKKSN
jgi:hypothetical protein